MAFFAGLMLFKDIYLFALKNGKLKELGYVNMETRLANLFVLPESENVRILHLAAIYKILHRDIDEKEVVVARPIEEDNKNNARIHDILISDDFISYYNGLSNTLAGLGFDLKNNSNEDLADLRSWLNNYVNENDISYEALFNDCKC